MHKSINSKEFPLVSVCVITYNSSQFILETLDSIKKQTYKNLELIISDDASTDNTVEIVKIWLIRNQSRFISSQVFIADKNTGVSGNCNRAVKIAKGDWVKLLAGDDLLAYNAIEEYVSFVQKMKCDICFAKLKLFGEDLDLVQSVNKIYNSNYNYYIAKLGAKEQKRKILKNLFIPGLGLFYSRDLWIEVDGYDENYQFCEEYPFTYNVLATGRRIYYIDKSLVLYRVRKNSLCREELGMNVRVFADHRKYFFDQRLKRLLKAGYLFHAWHESIILFYKSLVYKYGKRSIYAKLSRLLYFFSPLTYINIFNRLIIKKQ